VRSFWELRLFPPVEFRGDEQVDVQVSVAVEVDGIAVLGMALPACLLAAAELITCEETLAGAGRQRHVIEKHFRFISCACLKGPSGSFTSFRLKGRTLTGFWSAALPAGAFCGWPAAGSSAAAPAAKSIPAANNPAVNPMYNTLMAITESPLLAFIWILP